MREQANKQRVRDLLAAADAGDLVARFYAAFSDTRHTIEDIVAETAPVTHSFL